MKFRIMVLCIYGILMLDAIGISAESKQNVIHPVLASWGSVVGGTMNGKWLSAAKTIKYMHGKEVYRLYSSESFLGQSVGSKPQEFDSDTYFVRLSPKRQFGIAISGGWNAMVRKTTQTPHPTKSHLKAVTEILAAKGLATVSPRIVSVYSVDLDGDKKNESVIYAQDKDFDEADYRKGSYSFVVVQKTIGNKVRTYILDGQFNAADEAKDYPSIYYSPAGFWDVDGDGVFEVVVNWRCPRASSLGVGIYKVAYGKATRMAWHLIEH